MRWAYTTHTHEHIQTRTHKTDTWSAFVVYCTSCEHCPIWDCFPAAGCGGATRPRSTTPTSYEFDKQPAVLLSSCPSNRSTCTSSTASTSANVSYITVHNIIHRCHKIYGDKLNKRHQNNLCLYNSAAALLICSPTETNWGKWVQECPQIISGLDDDINMSHLF